MSAEKYKFDSLNFCLCDATPEKVKSVLITIGVRHKVSGEVYLHSRAFRWPVGVIAAVVMCVEMGRVYAVMVKGGNLPGWKLS